MSKPLSLETDPDLYFLTEASELISDQVRHDKGHRDQLAREMRKATVPSAPEVATTFDQDNGQQVPSKGYTAYIGHTWTSQ